MSLSAASLGRMAPLPFDLLLMSGREIWTLMCGWQAMQPNSAAAGRQRTRPEPGALARREEEQRGSTSSRPC